MGQWEVTHLVALGAVTAKEYHILASIVQARAIPSYFPGLAQHPVLFRGGGGAWQKKRRILIQIVG